MMVTKLLNNRFFLVYGFALWFFSACGGPGSSSKNIKKLDELKVETLSMESVDDLVKINHVNFYFENSASMNGYLEGKNFKQTLHKIFGNIDEDKLKTFFVNTKEHSTTDMLKRIDKKDINVGDISNSDHEFIFSNAIENAIDNNISIVVTDGIYSLKGGDTDIVEIEIENTFKKALKEVEIETVVLKLSSNFDGTYYSESCEPGHKAIKINQSRPYYILLFGNKQIVDSVLKDIVVKDDLPGFEKEARFFVSKGNKVEYSILTLGEEKHGKFKKENREDIIVKSIIDGEKTAEKGSNNNSKEVDYLQFGIAVDYSKLSIPNSYLTDRINYSVDESVGYEIEDVKAVWELDKKSKTYKFLKGIEGEINFTHIVVVKSSKNLYGDLIIYLENNLPSWIESTGVEDDCGKDLIGNKTWKFDKLINGISNAYRKTDGGSDKYLEMNLKIKP